VGLERRRPDDLGEVPSPRKNISKSLQKIVAQKPAGPVAEVKKAAADLESVAQGGRRAGTARRPAPPAATTPLPCGSCCGPAARVSRSR
jgi:hypothetical protein